MIFDLVATRNGQRTAYEFKSAGHSRSSRAQLAHLQKVAANAGYRFRIVVAVPPPRVEVEVDDLSQGFLDYLIDHVPGNLDSLSSHTRIDSVEDLSFSSVKISPDEIHVAGSGSISVDLEYGGSSDNFVNSDSFPFTFSARLSAGGKLREVEELDVDTSGFYE